MVCEDFKHLKKEVEDLINSPDRIKKLGDKGFEYAQNFTKERFISSWEDLLKKVLL
jgi:hypothetical protein